MAQTKKPKKLRWTWRRCDEYQILRQLLLEIGTLDHGSGFIDRLKRCIALAKKLNPSSLRGPPGFLNFLLELSLADAHFRRPRGGSTE